MKSSTSYFYRTILDGFGLSSGVILALAKYAEQQNKTYLLLISTSLLLASLVIMATKHYWRFVLLAQGVVFLEVATVGTLVHLSLYRHYDTLITWTLIYTLLIVIALPVLFRNRGQSQNGKLVSSITFVYPIVGLLLATSS